MRVQSALPRRVLPAGVAGIALLIAILLLAAVVCGLCLPALANATTAYSAQELEVLQLINQYREANGLNALLLSDTISDACTKHNLDMGKYGFTGHTTQSSDYFYVGSLPWDRMRICGYDYDTFRGEVLGYGYTSAQAVLEAWKDSTAHNAVLLGGQYRVAGVSIDEVPGSAYTYYWTIDFGGIIDPSAHDPGDPSPTTTSTTLPPTSTTTTLPPTSTTTTLPPATTTTLPPPTTTTTASPSTTTTLPAPQFIDVSPANIFYREITTLAAASVVCGYKDNTYRPFAEVTRAQFAKIIMLAIGGHTEQVEGIDHQVFRDVKYTGQPYPYDFVQEAAVLGIIKGNADGTFGPYQNLTRAQLALMLVRAGGADLALPPPGFVLSFTDVPAYLKAAVAVAYYNGLLSGKTATTFDPYGVATRGQVAKMIYNLMALMRS